jgi:signal transduction histidine kinase
MNRSVEDVPKNGPLRASRRPAVLALAGFGHGAGYGLPLGGALAEPAPAPASTPLLLTLLLAAAVLAVLVAFWWRHAGQAARRCARLSAELARERARRAQAERALRDTQVSLTHLAAERRSTRDAERHRIGRDIHDDLGQHLLALQLDIGSLHNNGQLPPGLRQQTAHIERHIHLTIRSLRTVINDLRPAALDGGLGNAAQRQLDDIARLSGLRCELRTVGLDGQAAGATENALFRLLQEALSNVVRHARASLVEVTLAREASGFRLAVRDDGIGLAASEAPRGMGLTGMADRVAAAGGRMTLDSRPGQGTTVAITLPLVAARRDAPTRATPAESCA